ncbi:protein of unknown function [Bradyrhizobium vignae]|uniref:Uncharacterized protein n=1 Tax=Bradyrhizobium vignae TaxID=1549949 RepID=A0A2U3PVE8_9BRAD|nr:protein of unknown function [Bradyrhizobium vignae]
MRYYAPRSFPLKVAAGGGAILIFFVRLLSLIIVIVSVILVPFSRIRFRTKKSE